jgi:NADPH-dependent curcumin reductase CurA
MENMNQHGRIAQCGSISTYNHIFEENKLITGENILFTSSIRHLTKET